MTSEWTETLEFVLRLADKAGEVVMSYYQGEYEVSDKAGQPVTDADRDANALIVEALAAEFPEDAILAEETPVEDDSWSTASRCWVIDPLDGTSDFVKGREGFCVMIGLLVDGRPKLGVVRVPVPDRTFLGVVGEGAWEVVGDERRPLATSDRATGPQLRVIASIAHRDAALDRALTAIEPNETLSVGSVGYKVGQIVADQADVYVATTHHTSLWDTCAPEAILRAAGGDWVDLDGQPLNYRGPALNHPRGLLATNGASTADVVARLAGKFPVLD